MKFQIPNHKFQTNPNNQNSNDQNMEKFGYLIIGIWNLFGIWYLVLGI